MEWISLFGLLCFVGFAAYRMVVRRRHLREAAQAREEAFIASLRGSVAVPSAGLAEAALADVRQTPRHAVAATELPSPGVAMPAGRVAGRRLPAYLSARQLKVFRLLRECAPGSAVFARGYLHWLVGASAGEKPQRLDFVCCDEGATPRVVIDLIRDTDEPAAWKFKRERLEAEGLSYLRWDPERLPAREEVAALLAPLDGKA